MARPSLRDVPERIQWHEGMLLTPRHFSELTSRYEELLQYALLHASPFLWGVRKLEIDTHRLMRGEFAVLALEAIMPDGLPVSYSSSSKTELVCKLSEISIEERSEGIPVYLLVPMVSGLRSHSNELSRFASQEEGLDEEIEYPEESIPRLLPKLEVVAGKEAATAKFVSLPIARLVYENEAYILSDYLPPMAEVAPDSSVGVLCHATVRRVRERAIYLSQQLQTFSATARKQFGELQRTRIRGMVTALPALEALLHSGAVNPFLLYTAYCNLAGNLSILSETIVPPIFSPYQHGEILESFQQVDRYIHAVLREGIPENYLPVTFTFQDDVFSVLFEPEWASRRLILVMRFAPGVDHREAVAWGEQTLIGSASLQQGMRERRVLGASHKHLLSEEGLVPSSGGVLFHLNYDAEYIHPNELLQIVSVSSRREAMPVEIVLYIRISAANNS